MKKLLTEFKEFIAKGDIVDLAVAVVMGLAFNAVVSAFVKDVVMTFIGAIFGKPSFDYLTWKVGSGVVLYGDFITAVVNFLIIAASIFFAVKAYNAMKSFGKGDTVEEKEANEVELLAEIRDLLRNK